MKNKLTKIIVASSLIVNFALVGAIGYVSMRVNSVPLYIKAPVFVPALGATAASAQPAAAK